MLAFVSPLMWSRFQIGSTGEAVYTVEQRKHILPYLPVIHFINHQGEQNRAHLLLIVQDHHHFSTVQEFFYPVATLPGIAREQRLMGNTDCVSAWQTMGQHSSVCNIFDNQPARQI